MTIGVIDKDGAPQTIQTIDDLTAIVGAKADTAVTAVDTTPGSVVALLKGIISKLAGTLTVAAHAVTNAGTFAVQNTAATPAGTNIVGKVGIDQTTDGTTNLVSAKQNGTWLAKLSDGTNAVAVKPASTAPTATDPAIVVALSPNGLNPNGQAAMAASAPSTIASDQSTISIAADTSKIANGASGTYLTPKRSLITASSSGATTVVAAVSGKKIRVLGLSISANAAVNIKWQSHVTPTDLTGLLYCAAAGDGEVLPTTPLGWFETVSGEALDINLSGAVAVGGHLTYVEV